MNDLQMFFTVTRPVWDAILLLVVWELIGWKWVNKTDD